jgi:hypothetical protein
MPENDGRKSVRKKACVPRAASAPGVAADSDLMPDVRSRRFKTEAHRQSLAVAESGLAQADQDFIDAVSELRGE